MSLGCPMFRGRPAAQFITQRTPTSVHDLARLGSRKNKHSLQNVEWQNGEGGRPNKRPPRASFTADAHCFCSPSVACCCCIGFSHDHSAGLALSHDPTLPLRSNTVRSTAERPNASEPSSRTDRQTDAPTNQPASQGSGRSSRDSGGGGGPTSSSSSGGYPPPTAATTTTTATTKEEKKTKTSTMPAAAAGARAGARRSRSSGCPRGRGLVSVGPRLCALLPACQQGERALAVSLEPRSSFASLQASLI